MSRLSTALIAALVAAGVTFVLQYLGVFTPHPVEVPPLKGLSTTQARAILESRSLLLVLDGEVPDPSPAGTLAQQHPLSGSQVQKGSTVYGLVAVAPTASPAPAAPAPVAIAPPPPAPVAPVAAPPPTPASPPAPVAVAAPPTPPAPAPAPGSKSHTGSAIPHVIGKRLPQARDAIQRAGYTVGDVRYGNDGDVGPDRVLRQSPPSGSAAAPGTRIDLVVNESE